MCCVQSAHGWGEVLRTSRDAKVLESSSVLWTLCALVTFQYVSKNVLELPNCKKPKGSSLFLPSLTAVHKWEMKWLAQGQFPQPSGLGEEPGLRSQCQCVHVSVPSLISAVETLPASLNGWLAPWAVSKTQAERGKWDQHNRKGKLCYCPTAAYQCCWELGSQTS